VEDVLDGLDVLLGGNPVTDGSMCFVLACSRRGPSTRRVTAGPLPHHPCTSHTCPTHYLSYCRRVISVQPPPARLKVHVRPVQFPFRPPQCESTSQLFSLTRSTSTTWSPVGFGLLGWRLYQSTNHCCGTCRNG